MALVVNHFSLGLFDNVPVILLWLFTIRRGISAFTGYIAGITKCARCGRYMWCIIREHYNLSLGVRNSWYSSLTSIPFFMLLAMLGVPLQVFLAVSIIHYSW